MSKEYKTIEYSGAYFSEYARERAELISQGWKIEDENLKHSETKSRLGYLTGRYVTGCVVYSREQEKTP